MLRVCGHCSPGSMEWMEGSWQFIWREFEEEDGFLKFAD